MTDRHVRAVDRTDAKARRYLGDGVYAASDGYAVWLTAENGLAATDAIYLEPNVIANLARFWADVRRGSDATSDPTME